MSANTNDEQTRGRRGLRIGALALRTAFICSLVALTMRVSGPQNETFWSAYETPGDLVRVVLGLATCLWILIQSFELPQDAQAHATLIYLGLVGVPFALICLVAIW
jgi:hypothetical protein